MHRTATPTPAPRATVGRHALTPAPIRTARHAGVRWVRVALAVAAVAMLAACGGGGDPADVQCNPDTLDCSSMYAEYPFRAVPDSAQGSDVYTFNPAPRAGYTIVSN